MFWPECRRALVPPRARAAWPAPAPVSLKSMWYFAYGSNLNSRAVSEWCRHFGHKAPSMKPGRPSVLDNYRLSFPIFSEYYGGGIADIVYDPGKYVMGALFDLPDADLAVLDQKVGRKVDAAGKEIGVYKRIDVKVAPLGK